MLNGRAAAGNSRLESGNVLLFPQLHFPIQDGEDRFLYPTATGQVNVTTSPGFVRPGRQEMNGASWLRQRTRSPRRWAQESDMFKAIIFFSLIFLAESGLAGEKTNDIYNFKILKQTEDSVLFEISYYYSGDHGDKAKLTAWPKPPGFWGSSIIPLEAGNHTTQLNVKLMPKVTKEVVSDSVEFFYYVDSGPPFYRKDFVFKKKWINEKEKSGASPK